MMQRIEWLYSYVVKSSGATIDDDLKSIPTFGTCMNAKLLPMACYLNVD